MLRKFLALYLKRAKKRFILFIIVITLTFLITITIAQWYITFAITITLSILYYLHLEIKQARICILIDTYNLQQLFMNESHIPAIKGKKFRKAYKKWLMRYVLENNIDITYIFFFSSELNIFCCYCFFNFIPMMIILFITSIYLPLIQGFIITFSFLFLSMTFFVLMEQRAAKQKYKLLDSDIKRIIFEEQTGYSPLNNNKFTFKYKVWLIVNERKQNQAIFINTI